MAPPLWTSIPTGLSDQWDQQQKANDWASDQQADLANDWADQQKLNAPPTPAPTPAPPTRDDWATSPPEPAAGAPPTPDGSGVVPPPSPPTTPAPAAGATPSPADVAGTTGLMSNPAAAADRPSQFGLGLSSADAMAFCGPTAAIAFAKTYGRNPTVDEAKQLALSVGWNPNQGMAGVASEQALLTKMGVQTKLEQGVDWNHVASDANNGNPVIIDTPGHYFYVTGARQGANGMEFNVGTSGTDLRRGATWMTANQMATVEGAPRAALYADHPLADGPSVAEQSPLANVTGAIGAFAQGVKQKAADVVSAVQDVGGQLVSGAQDALQNSPVVSGQVNAAQGTVQSGQVMGDTASAGLNAVGMGPQAIQARGADDVRAMQLLGPAIKGTISPDDQQWLDNYNAQQAKVVGGAEGGGMDVSKGRPLFGRGGVPGANVGRNPVPVGTNPDDLTNALQQSQYQAVVKQIRDAGWTDDQITQSLKAQGVPDEQIQSVLNPQPLPTQPPAGPLGPQNPPPTPSTPPVAAAPVTPASPPPTPPTPVAGAAGWPAAPVPPVPAAPVPPTPPGGAPPVGGGGGGAAAVGGAAGAGSPKGLPQSAMQALREYAAAVGPQSNAALVDAEQLQRAAAPTGINMPAVVAGNKTAARQVLDQKLAALGLTGDPQVQQFIRNVETPSAVPNMPILGGLQRAQQEIKGVVFPLSMFHGYTEGLYSTFSQPSGAKDFASAFFSTSPTQGAQNSPMWLRAAKAGVTHLFDSPGAPDALNTSSGLQGAAIRAGIGGVGGAGAGYTESKLAGDTDEQARQNALIYGLAGAAGAAAAKPLISDNLWRAVQYSKAKTFESLVNGGVEDQVAASAVNRTFGGLNYAQMGRDQTFQGLLQLTVQAPDWGESTLRQLGSAFFGRDAGAGFSRGLLARTVIGSALATEVLNMVFTGHTTMDNEPGHQAQVQLPSGTADKPVYVGIGPGNLQAYADLADKIAANPSNTLTSYYQGQRQAGDIPQFIGNRVAAVPAGAYELATGQAFGGNKAPLAAEVASKVAPISVGTAVQAQHENMSPAAEALLLGAGANPRYGKAPAQQPIKTTKGAQPPSSSPLDVLSGLFKTSGSSQTSGAKRSKR